VGVGADFVGEGSGVSFAAGAAGAGGEEKLKFLNIVAVKSSSVGGWLFSLLSDFPRWRSNTSKSRGWGVFFSRFFLLSVSNSSIYIWSNYHSLFFSSSLLRLTFYVLFAHFPFVFSPYWHPFNFLPFPTYSFPLVMRGPLYSVVHIPSDATASTHPDARKLIVYPSIF